VRASFPVAWKNARAKALYTAGETVVKPAAMKIMCSDAVRNRVSYMILLSNNTIKWRFVLCADGASAMMRTKKIFSVYENGKQKYLGTYCLLHR